MRTTRAIQARLGYTEPVVDYALDRIFFSITRASLTATIAAELGSVAALDAVQLRDGVPGAWARPAGRAVVVASDTTIGVALLPAIFALCAKCDVVVKDRADALVAGFFASLVEEHPLFADAAQARQWSGGADADEDALLDGADVVVAFGGDTALRAIRARCGTETRFVPYGHRASIGRLTAGEAAALDAAGADAIARDALLYDGEGCLSLHALYVAGDDAVQQHVAGLLDAACARVATEFPAGTPAPAREAAVAAYRNLAAFRAAGGSGAVYRGGGATLVAGITADEAPPLLPRVLPIYRVADDAAVAAAIEHQRLPVQALGAVAADADSIALAARIGAVRVAPFGTMQDPPLSGHHGGSARIADFVRWIDGA